MLTITAKYVGDEYTNTDSLDFTVTLSNPVASYFEDDIEPVYVEVGVDSSWILPDLQAEFLLEELDFEVDLG